MTYLLVAAALADSLTMLLLPAGAERNPIASAAPVVALVLKALLTGLLLGFVLRRFPYSRLVGWVAVVAWTTGAISNLAVLA